MATSTGEAKAQAINFWLGKSRYDLTAARAMYNARTYLYTGFMCHQSIEKALKAYYIHRNDERQPQTHNLELLTDLCKLSSKMDAPKLQTLHKLKPLYTATRYEDDGDKVADLLTKPYCKKLLKETEVLLDWIIQSMKQL